MKTELAPAEHLFALEYARVGNPYYAATTASISGRLRPVPELLADPQIQAAVRAALEEQEGNTPGTPAHLIKQLWALSQTSPADLFEVSTGCCRCCWGRGFEYQRTARELKLHLKSSKDEEGGPGYDPRRPPNADCPECFGRGETRTRLRNLNELSPELLGLIASVDLHPNGSVKLRLTTRVRLYQMLGTHHGLFRRGKSSDAPVVKDHKLHILATLRRSTAACRAPPTATTGTKPCPAAPSST